MQREIMFKKFKKSTREYWVATLTKIAHPVLHFEAQDELKSGKNLHISRRLQGRYAE